MVVHVVGFTTREGLCLKLRAAAAISGDNQLYVFVDQNHTDQPPRKKRARTEDEGGDLIATLFQAAGLIDPRMPLSLMDSRLGWTAVLVCTAAGEDAVLLTEPDEIETVCWPKLKRVELLVPAEAVEQPLVCAPVVPAEMLGKFAHVAVGGTFDRLHAGHRQLLFTASAICAQSSGKVYIGVTGDELLVNKKFKELLQPFDDRVASAVAVVQAVHPDGLFSPEAIVSCLAKTEEPPKAATMSEMQALVVSRETVSGALRINAMRVEAGFEELEVITIDLVGADNQNADAPKVSSSDLRQADAKR